MLQLLRGRLFFKIGREINCVDVVIAVTARRVNNRSLNHYAVAVGPVTDHAGNQVGNVFILFNVCQVFAVGNAHAGILPPTGAQIHGKAVPLKFSSKHTQDACISIPQHFADTGGHRHRKGGIVGQRGRKSKGTCNRSIILQALHSS